MILKLIAACVLAALEGYLLGSIVFGIMISKLFCHDDVRTHGSGSAGMTNMLRTYGAAAGAATAIGDVAKGAVAVFIGQWLFEMLVPQFEPACGAYLAAIFAAIGHMKPAWFGFHGGKGVLVAATTLLALDPLSCVFALIVFAVILYFTKYVSLASMFSCLSAPVFTIITQAARGIDSYAVNALMLYCLALLIVYKHKPNIERLNNGVENKFSFGSHKRKKE